MVYGDPQKNIKVILMHPYIETVIPDWLYKEVEEYFTPLPFVPRTILDIGANVGAFAQRANQKWPAAKIYCFEPMPTDCLKFPRLLARLEH